jgi:crotonobetainyl-CoA:carnitine CoA-transferase CaiB-like acyl-CoA transferase
VIKIEMAPKGDPSRLGPLQVNGRSGYFVQHNRGKRDICVDLKHPDGLAIAKDLLRQADVMVENFAPGVIGRLGLSYEVVRELNPALVMCSISAFGQAGPLADAPGFDYLGASYAGVVSMCGEADGSPYVPMIAFGDVSTGALRWVRSARRCWAGSAPDAANISISPCSILISTTTKLESRRTA